MATLRLTLANWTMLSPSKLALTAGTCGGRSGDGFEDEIVDGVFVAAGLFGSGIDLGAQGEDGAGIHFDVEIEVRDLRFGIEEALGDDGAHAGQRDAGVVRTGHRTDGLHGLGSTAGSGNRGRLHVHADNAAAGAGTFEAAQIDTALGSNPAGQRGSLDFAIGRRQGGGLGRRRTRGAGGFGSAGGSRSSGGRLGQQRREPQGWLHRASTITPRAAPSRALLPAGT